MPYLAIDQFGAKARADIRRQFDGAQPFPHVVFDGLLAADEEIVQHFPDPEWSGWLRYADDYQPGKLCATDLSAMPQPFQQILVEMNSRPFLVFLEQITGIEGLVPDPYLEGGGLHSSGPGGVLQPHTDFHFYERLHMFRRVNALLYLNPGWRDEDGGSLTFFDEQSEQPKKEISPVFGRLVVFRTDDKSIHGFTRPVSDGHRRNSIATYYYTAQDAAIFSGDGNVYWKRHGTSSGFGRLRFGLYHALLRASRMFSVAAHLANPHHGLRARRNGAESERRARASSESTD